VLFVCEHGSAKSVLAAAHFNKLAREKRISVRAISRGTDPDDEIPSNVWKGLEADGLIPAEAKPRLLREEDVSGAIRVITFCDLPQNIKTRSAIVSSGDVPPVSEDYCNARDEISKRAGKLLGEFEATR
jgi:protein-tyrosine-phosphatase